VSNLPSRPYPFERDTVSHIQADTRWSKGFDRQEFATSNRAIRHFRKVAPKVASRSRLRRPSLSRHDKELTVRKSATSTASKPAGKNMRPAECPLR
jgi:hypothetical protein